MPLSNSTVDTWVANNSASASGLRTQTQFEQALWKAVNLARSRPKRKAMDEIRQAYPSLDPASVVSTLEAEVRGVLYP